MTEMLFYNKHQIVPKSVADIPLSQTQPLSSADWFPIKQILNRKIRDTREMFLVLWDDDKQTKTWVPTADVTDYTAILSEEEAESKDKTP